MKRYSITLLLFFLSIPSFAQENIFLQRSFWNSNTSIAEVDQKIQEGHDISALNENGFDAVTYSILENAPIATIQYIQSKPGNSVDKITHDRRTYIFWAAYKGNIPLMKYLLEQGANTALKDDKGYSILNFAASTGQQNTQVYDVCLAHGAELNTDLTPNGANALLLSIAYDTDLSLLNYFVTKGISLTSKDKKGNNAFNYAAKTGNIKMMKYLHTNGIKGDDRAFLFASQGTRNTTNGIEVFKYLEGLGLQANVLNEEGQNPLHILAYRSKDTLLMRHLLTKNINVNSADTAGNTPFLNAVQSNTLEMVSFLWPKVKDINFQNNKGATALSLALANNTSEVVTFLLKNGASVQAKDKEGNNVAHYLLEAYTEKDSSDFYSKMDILKNAKFSMTSPQQNGNTLFHLAVAHNSIALLKTINQFSIDVNDRNEDGLTALHIAAMKATDTHVLNYLISIGASTKLVTDFEETAYDLALENEVLSKTKQSLSFLK